MIAAGRGRPVPSPSAQLITAPCEKPPRTIRPDGTGRSSRNAASSGEGRVERLRIRRRDSAELVPVRSARRERERSARRDAEQPALRVERVQQRVQVVLVGAAPVQQHERAGRLAGRRAVRERPVAQVAAPTGAGLERRQHLLDLVAQMLERGRQDERLAEVLGVLVDREARPERRDLEQHAARLAEVDRPEPEAVDHRRRAQPGDWRRA